MSPKLRPQAHDAVHSSLAIQKSLCGIPFTCAVRCGLVGLRGGPQYHGHGLGPHWGSAAGYLRRQSTGECEHACSHVATAMPASVFAHNLMCLCRVQDSVACAIVWLQLFERGALADYYLTRLVNSCRLMHFFNAQAVLQERRARTHTYIGTHKHSGSHTLRPPLCRWSQALPPVAFLTRTGVVLLGATRHAACSTAKWLREPRIGIMAWGA